MLCLERKSKCVIPMQHPALSPKTPALPAYLTHAPAEGLTRDHLPEIISTHSLKHMTEGGK